MLSSSHYLRTIQFTLSCSLYSVSVQRPARHPSYTIHLIFDSPLHPKHYMGHPSLSFARFCDTSVSKSHNRTSYYGSWCFLLLPSQWVPVLTPSYSLPLQSEYLLIKSGRNLFDTWQSTSKIGAAQLRFVWEIAQKSQFFISGITCMQH